MKDGLGVLKEAVEQGNSLKQFEFGGSAVRETGFG